MCRGAEMRGAGMGGCVTGARWTAALCGNNQSRGRHFRNMRRTFLFTAMTLLASLAAPTQARVRVDAVNQDDRKIAMHGYDAVAYFTDGRPVNGSARFGARWMGASWMFSTAEHRDLFQKEPEKYAPQYGGYCAWAVSQGYTANGDPEAWRIVNGKLYLNYNKSVQKKWERERDVRIQEGDRNWPGLHK